MSSVQHTPDFGTEAKRMLQALKDDVSLLVRAIAMPAQRRKRQGMSRILSEIELAF